MGNNWMYYNHAIVPILAPHENPSLEEINNKNIWKVGGGGALFIRWTSDFDCKKTTNFWYIICDRPFDISNLNAKKRNVIKNGLKYCNSNIVNPLEYEDELLLLHNEAEMTYPKENRSIATKESFHKYLLRIKDDSSKDFYICFLKENNLVVGYAVVVKHDSYCELQSQKARPSYERYQVNASLVYRILSDYSDRLGNEFYISDGARNINHKTHFQDYLEKYFGFRKAYCNLHVKYKKGFGFLIKALYPFRRLLKKFDNKKLFHKINGVLKMEEIIRGNQ